MGYSDVEDITYERTCDYDPNDHMEREWAEAQAWGMRVGPAVERSPLAFPGLWHLLASTGNDEGVIEVEAEVPEVPRIVGSSDQTGGVFPSSGTRGVPDGGGTERDVGGVIELEGDLRGVDLRRVGRRSRLQATAFFLTYSQSKLSKEQVANWMARQPRVKRCIVAQEHHKDGNVHYHSLIEYEKAKDVTTKYFDILTEHPNIKVWTDRRSTYDEWMRDHWNYCLKEDQDCFKIGHAPENRKRKRDEIYTEAFKLAYEKGVDDAIGYLKVHGAYDLCTKYQSIEFAMYRERNKALAPRIPARSVDTFTHPPMINPDWRNLYISGPTGCGKTAYARALLPEATVVSHRDQLRDCDFSKGIIFDDFDVGHWPPTAVIHLLDWEEARGIDVKHAHVVIPAKTRKIFTHNRKFEEWIPQEKISEEQIAAMRRRVDVVIIHTKLF